MGQFEEKLINFYSNNGFQDLKTANHHSQSFQSLKHPAVESQSQNASNSMVRSAHGGESQERGQKWSTSLIKKKRRRYFHDKLKLKQAAEMDDYPVEQKEVPKREVDKEIIAKSIEERKKRIELKKFKDNTEYKKVLQSTPLFKKIEEDYHSNMVVPELNAKKEILKLIRRMNRPIDPQEIKDHEKQWSSHRRKIIQSLAQKRKTVTRTSHLNNKFKLNMRSSHAESMLESKQSFDTKSRMLHYANFIRESMQPKISSIKRQIVEEMKKKIPNNRYNRSERGNQDLRKSVENLQSNFDKLDQSKGRNIKTIQNDGAPKPKRNRDALVKKNPMIPPPKEPRIDKSVDYLKIKARRREGNPISDLYYKTKEVETVLNKSGSTRDKYEAVRTYSRIVGEKVDSFDHKTAKSIDEVANINDILIKSIKAKLSLLSEI